MSSLAFNLGIHMTKIPLRSLVLAGLALLLTGCQLLAGQWNTPSSGSVLFQDNFSNPSNRWLTTLSEVGLAGVYRGAFRFVVNVPNVNIWTTPGVNFGDVRLETDAAQLGGPEENRMGLVCRYQGPGDFYFFVISSDGYYAVGKVTQDAVSLLGQEQMQYSAAITTGMAINHLRADCVGETLTFYVNYFPVALVQDSDHPRGDVGLLAGTFEQTGVDVIFDNFVVLKP
jgi:hypothetical protein